jgi:RNA polymerase sigma factor (sigma-70 family)
MAAPVTLSRIQNVMGEMPITGVASGRFESDQDEDLLAYMAMREDPSRRDAGAEFHRRHAGFIWGVLKKLRVEVGLGGEHALQDVVQDAFLRAYERSETYESCRSVDGNRQRQAVRRWLIGIAKNVIREKLSRPVSITATVPLEDFFEFAEVPVPVTHESDATRLMGEAFSELNEREQDVLRTTMLHFKPGEKAQRLPNAVLQALAAQLGTTPENIRAIRKRASDKLRARLASHFSPKQEVRA